MYTIRKAACLFGGFVYLLLNCDALRSNHECDAAVGCQSQKVLSSPDVATLLSTNGEISHTKASEANAILASISSPETLFRCDRLQFKTTLSTGQIIRISGTGFSKNSGLRITFFSEDEDRVPPTKSAPSYNIRGATPVGVLTVHKVPNPAADAKSSSNGYKINLKIFDKSGRWLPFAHTEAPIRSNSDTFMVVLTKLDKKIAISMYGKPLNGTVWKQVDYGLFDSPRIDDIKYVALNPSSNVKNALFYVTKGEEIDTSDEADGCFDNKGNKLGKPTGLHK